VYGVHNHRARIRLARGFQNGDLVGGVRGNRGRLRHRKEGRGS
jgi:hypothetical protein